MAKAKPQQFKLDQAWMISQNGQSLIISGGADARYEVELETPDESFFASVKPGVLFTRASLNTTDKNVLEQLITAEIIVPALRKSSVIKVRLLGETDGLQLSDSQSVEITGSGPYDLAVVVRSHKTFAELLNDLNYIELTTPQLFVDTSFHHTVSIGPLVFPGETACIACLQGRIGKRWGDEAPPAQPRATTTYKNLTQELVLAELAAIAGGSTSLTNKTVSWNIKDRDIATNQLLKVPLCPVCSQNSIDPSGALALPWVQR